MQIIFEDNHLIIVNKTNDELVQADADGKKSLEEVLKEYVKQKYNKPGNVFISAAHRIDRPVSGIVIFAKTSKALARMSDLFKDGKVRKVYWAIVQNRPPSDSETLMHFLRRDGKINKSHCSNTQVENSKAAILDYRVLASSDNYFLLEINLKTGRHHQIRAQLSFIGCPIKGDVKYGFRRPNKEGGISLHAREIEFEHPVKKEIMKFVSESTNGK
ncbi:MAG: RNA pseudouridine synthase [Bacteroidales bacterium]|nr:RNA pseudouridine synthase [Bacteroidales bacterium]